MPDTTNFRKRNIESGTICVNGRQNYNIFKILFNQNFYNFTIQIESISFSDFREVKFANF